MLSPKAVIFRPSLLQIHLMVVNSQIRVLEVLILVVLVLLLVLVVLVVLVQGSGSGAPDTEVDQNSPDQITAPSSEKVIGAVKYRVCTNCGGDGEVQLITYDQQGRHVVTRTCSVCNGRGLVPV